MRKILSIKSNSLFLIRLWGKVEYYVEKSYVDRLAARKLRDCKLFITSHQFFIDQKRFLPDIDFLTVFNNMIFDSSKERGCNLNSSVVVHELELAINRDLYGCLCSLGSQ